MKRVLLCVVAVLGLVNHGCASAVRGTSEDLSIESTPNTAVATLSDGQTCTTPCTLRISRGKAYDVKFSKSGCIDQTEVVQPHVSGSGVAEGLFPLLTYSLAVDSMNGAIYDAKPNPVTSNLQCISTSEPTFSPPVTSSASVPKAAASNSPK
jgi:hypothetical protein